jgi:hypothetical protein
VDENGLQSLAIPEQLSDDKKKAIVAVSTATKKQY